MFTVPPFWFIFVAFHTFSMSAGAMDAARLADRLESPLFFSMKWARAVGVLMLRLLDDEACGALSYDSSLTRRSWAPALCAGFREMVCVTLCEKWADWGWWVHTFEFLLLDASCLQCGLRE